MEIESIRLHLKQSVTSQDSEQLRVSSEYLQTCQKTFEDYIQILINILQSEDPSPRQLIEQQILQTVKKYQAQCPNTQKIQTAIDTLLHYFYNLNIDIQSKFSLVLSLSTLLSLEKNAVNSSVVAQKVIDDLKQNKEQFFFPNLLIIQGVLPSFKYDQSLLTLQTFYNNIKQPLFDHVFSIFNLLLENQVSSVQKLSESQQYQDIFKQLELFSQILLVIVRLFNQKNTKFFKAKGQKTESPDISQQEIENNQLLQLAQDQQLIQIICGIFEYLDNFSLRKNPLSLIFSTIQNNLLNTIITLNNHIYSFNQLQLHQRCPEYNTLQSNFLVNVVNSLYDFTSKTNEDKEVWLKNKIYNSFMQKKLEYLSIMASFKCFQYFFFENYKKQPINVSIILNAIFPFLATSPLEMMLFYEDPKEFVNMQNDICDNQMSKTPKSEAASLLECLIDHLDNALSFTTYFCVHSINQNFTQQQNENLIPYLNYSYFTKYTSDQQLEIAFLCLSIISYMMNFRKDLITLLEENMEKFWVNRLYDNSPLVECRIVLFISYYVEELYQDETQKEMFKFNLQLLINALMNKVEAIQNQAEDALINCFDDEELYETLSPFAENILVSLNPVVANSDKESQYEILIVFLKKYSFVLCRSQKLIVLIQTLQQRVKQLLQKHSDKMILYRVWNLVKQISEDKNYIPKYQQEIEVILLIQIFLQNTIPLISTNGLLEYHQEILQITKSLVERSQNISPFILEYYKSFHQIFLHQQCNLQFIFPTVNQMIHYGKTLFNDPNNFFSLYEIIRQTFTQDNIDPFTLFKCCLLVEQIQQNFPNLLTEEHYRFLVPKILAKLDCKMAKNQLFNVLLLALVTNFDLLVTIMSDYFERFLQQLFQTYNYGDNSYDDKIIIKAFSLLILKITNVDYKKQLTEMIISIFQKKQNQPKITRKSSSYDFMSESNEDYLDSLNNNSQEGPEYDPNAILEGFQCPIKEEDEFQVFKFNFEILKQDPIFVTIVKGLSEQQQQCIRFALTTRNITQQDDFEVRKYRTLKKK